MNSCNHLYFSVFRLFSSFFRLLFRTLKIQIYTFLWTRTYVPCCCIPRENMSCQMGEVVWHQHLEKLSRIHLFLSWHTQYCKKSADNVHLPFCCAETMRNRFAFTENRLSYTYWSSPPPVLQRGQSVVDLSTLAFWCDPSCKLGKLQL